MNPKKKAINKLDKYFGKMCKICGHSFGDHRYATMRCPSGRHDGEYRRTRFKWGRFRQEFK